VGIFDFQHFLNLIGRKRSGSSFDFVEKVYLLSIYTEKHFDY